MLIFFNIIILLILATIFLVTEYHDFGANKIMLILCLSAFSLTCYLINVRRSSNLKGKIIKPSLLLLFGMCIIVFQNVIDLSIGNAEISDVVFYNSNLIVMGVSYGAMAIVAYIIGYISTSLPPSGCVGYTDGKSSLNLLVFLSVLFSLLFLSTIDTAFFTGQIYAESGSIAKSHTNNSEVLLGICNAAVLIQHAINNRGENLSFRGYLWRLPKIFLILFFVYIVLVLIRGTRFFAVRDLMLLVFSYIYCCRKQPMRNIWAITLCIIASILLSVISFSRSIITDDLSAKYSMGMEGFENRKSFSPTTLELANSQFCDMVALNMFEKQDNPHLYGAIQARYLSVIMIPNRILHKIWPVSIEKQGSAYLLTVKEMGRDSERGIGSTVYTDFYVDFGIMGMMICMMLLGCLLKKIDLVLYSDKSVYYPLHMVVLMVYISACAFYLSRSAFIPTIRMPIYAYLLLKSNYYLSRIRMNL